MENYGIYTMDFHGKLIMDTYYGLPWKTMEYLLWNSMENYWIYTYYGTILSIVLWNLAHHFSMEKLWKWLWKSVQILHSCSIVLIFHGQSMDFPWTSMEVLQTGNIQFSQIWGHMTSISYTCIPAVQCEKTVAVHTHK